MSDSKRATLAVLAAGIDAHLARFAADPALSHRVWVDARGQERKGTHYWNTSAYASGPRVSVVYVSYQGRSTLTRDQAETYLAWLDAGNVGKHYAALADVAPSGAAPTKREGSFQDEPKSSSSNPTEDQKQGEQS